MWLHGWLNAKLKPSISKSVSAPVRAFGLDL